MLLSVLKPLTCLPSVTGENVSNPNTSKVTLVNRQAPPVAKVQTKPMKEREQTLLQESSLVSSRREMMHLAAVSLCLTSLCFPATSEARSGNATVPQKITEKVDELKEKVGLSKGNVEGTVEDIKEKAGSAKGNVEGKVEGLKEKAGISKGNVEGKVEGLKEKAGLAKGNVEGNVEGLKEKAGLAKGNVEGKVEGLKEKAGTSNPLEGLKEKAGMSNPLEGLKEKAGMSNPLEGLKEKVGMSKGNVEGKVEGLKEKAGTNPQGVSQQPPGQKVPLVPTLPPRKYS